MSLDLIRVSIAVLSLGLLAVSCDSVSILPERRVVLNGREFFFRHIDSLRPASRPFTRFAYDGGDFFIGTPEAKILVNGIEIATEAAGARVANRRIALKADERLHFGPSMDWTVRGGASISPPPEPAPASYREPDSR